MLDYVTAGWSPDRNNVTAGGIPEQSKVREVKQCCHGHTWEWSRADWLEQEVRGLRRILSTMETVNLGAAEYWQAPVAGDRGGDRASVRTFGGRTLWRRSGIWGS